MSSTGVLIANRAEASLRVQRAVRARGLRAVTVHATDDADCPHVSSGDLSVALAGSGPAAYLDIDSIIAAATSTESRYIHPGWGFLSENSLLAQACADAGLQFVGPSPEVLSLLGDKARTRGLAEKLGLSLLQATGVVDDDAAGRWMRSEALEAVMVKAVGGGGGRGMREVRFAKDLPAALRRARSEALRASGLSDVYLERLLTEARHIEVQLIGDGVDICSLGLRDCSVQRRHQKMVEMAPPVGLDSGTRQQLVDAAITLAGSIGLSGLCTVEFLLDTRTGSWYFIEANPRLQVEHGITEALTGLDLVDLQLRVAAGDTLADLQLLQPPAESGTAAEARITLVVDAGATVERLDLPAGDVRIDTHLTPGYRPPPGYDPLMAKVIVHSPGPMSATISLLDDALAVTSIAGLETDISDIRRVLAQPSLSAGALTTGWFDDTARSTAQADLSDREVLTDIAGTIIEVCVQDAEVVRGGQVLMVVESMKMEHEIAAPHDGRVAQLEVIVGQSVGAGASLMRLEPVALDAVPELSDSTRIEGPATRADLTDLRSRRSQASDEGRPEAVARRQSRGKRTARQNIAALCEPGTFREAGGLVIAAQRTRRSVEELERETPADGIVTGFGHLSGRTQPVAVLAHDYTVLAGTQGVQGHKKAERLFEVARRRRTPVVIFAEGGGGRPGDVDDQSKATGMTLGTFVALGRLNGLVPTVAVVSGRCFAGNAAMAGACDVVVATKDANIGLGGPAMIAGGGLGNVASEDIGPAQEQYDLGVIDVLVDDEEQATRIAHRYVDLLTRRHTGWTCKEQSLLRESVPEHRRRVFDVRNLVDVLCDTGTVLELRAGFGMGIVTALARIEGRTVGVVANDGSHLGGAIDSDGADKMARFLQVCEAHGVPVLTLCDTPGFMVGPAAERTGAVRHVSRLLTVGPNLTVPLCTVIVRKAYGIGGQAMAGGSFRVPDAIVAWPTAELGAMGPEGAVHLGYRRELGDIADEVDRQDRFDDLLAVEVARGRPVNAASTFELDDIIDPAETRAWVVQSIESFDWSARQAPMRRIDTW